MAMGMLGSPRGRRAAKRLAMPEIKAALQDPRTWTAIALVVVPDGGSSHYEIDPDVGVLVHASLMPDQQPVMLRLGGLGAGGAYGVWRIPPPGTEVAVIVPNGSLDDDLLMVGVLASGGVPAELDGDTLVVKGPKVVIIADSSPVEVGQQGLTPQDALVHGSGIDPFTGTPYYALGNTSGKISAKK